MYDFLIIFCANSNADVAGEYGRLVIPAVRVHYNWKTIDLSVQNNNM